MLITQGIERGKIERMRGQDRKRQDETKNEGELE